MSTLKGLGQALFGWTRVCESVCVCVCVCVCWFTGSSLYPSFKNMAAGLIEETAQRFHFSEGDWSNVTISPNLMFKKVFRNISCEKNRRLLDPLKKTILFHLHNDVQSNFSKGSWSHMSNLLRCCNVVAVDLRESPGHKACVQHQTRVRLSESFPLDKISLTHTHTHTHTHQSLKSEEHHVRHLVAVWEQCPNKSCLQREKWELWKSTEITRMSHRRAEKNKLLLKLLCGD